MSTPLSAPGHDPIASARATVLRVRAHRAGRALHNPQPARIALEILSKRRLLPSARAVATPVAPPCPRCSLDRLLTTSKHFPSPTPRRARNRASGTKDLISAPRDQILTVL